MIVVAGTAPLQPGKGAQAEKLIEEVVRLTRAETGCHSYTFYTTVGDPNTIHVFEEWESDAALDAHMQQPHTQAFLAGLGELLSCPPDVKRYEVTAVTKLI